MKIKNANNFENLTDQKDKIDYYLKREIESNCHSVTDSTNKASIAQNFDIQKNFVNSFKIVKKENIIFRNMYNQI